jgi:predicted RNase H-like HicB family nuclease
LNQDSIIGEKETRMLKYHAAYYRENSGWTVVSVLDFPGVHSQGKGIRAARAMIKDALALMAECYLDEGRPLPKPNPNAKDREADFQEEIALVVRAKALAER